MNVWYTHKRAAQLKGRARLYGGIILFLAAATLAGCIILCSRVNTGNAFRLLGLTVGLSTLGGWAAMLLFFFGYRPAKAQAGHMAGLLESAPETHTGTLTVSKDSFQIPGSIGVRKARLKTGEETLSFNLNARYARNLPPEDAPVQVTVVRSFITGVEVCSHEEG